MRWPLPCCALMRERGRVCCGEHFVCPSRPYKEGPVGAVSSALLASLHAWLRARAPLRCLPACMGMVVRPFLSLCMVLGGAAPRSDASGLGKACRPALELLSAP